MESIDIFVVDFLKISSVAFLIVLLHLQLPQQENSFDCGLFLLHYLDLFVAEAPAKFNPSLITRSSNFVSCLFFHLLGYDELASDLLNLLCHGKQIIVSVLFP